MIDLERFKLAHSTNIKEWYGKTYPTDDMVSDMRDNVTFLDLFEAMDDYKDVYETIFKNKWGGDSLVRERCFQRLAEIMEVDYEYIYDQWMNCVG